MAVRVPDFTNTRRSLLLGVALLAPAFLARRAMAQTGALIDASEPDIADSSDPIIASARRPWTGDLDGMLDRGMIRIAIPFGLTTYFLDGPDQRGLTYDLVMQFEQFLKKRLGKPARLRIGRTSANTPNALRNCTLVFAGAWPAKFGVVGVRVCSSSARAPVMSIACL